MSAEVSDVDDEDAPAVIDVHPLFCEAEESAIRDGRGALKEPIETIDVCKFSSLNAIHSGPPALRQASFLAWLPANQLLDEAALLESFGPGHYQLVGRNLARNKILRRALIRVGLQRGAGDAQPAPAPAPSTNMDGALAMLMTEMRASREATQQMMLAFAQASREGAMDMVKAVSSLAASRVADQQGLINALSHTRGMEAGGASAMEKGAEMYERTLANAIGIAEQLRAKGAPNDEVELVNSFVEGVKALRNDPNAAANAAAVAAAREAQGNGQGGH